STDWPPRSKAAAGELLQAIKHSPLTQNLSEDTMGIPEDLRDALEQFTRVLQEVSTKLEKVASKYGTRKRGVRDRIKYYLAMLRGGRCTQVLQTCEDNVSKASTSVRNSIDQGVQGSAVSTGGVEGRPIVPTNEPNGSAPHTRVTQAVTSTPANQSAPPEVPAAVPTLNPLPKQDQRTNLSTEQPKFTGRRKALEIARKIFSSLDMVSGTIPVFGDCIGAGAKVGLTCVEMAEVMYDNEDTAEGLMARTTELSKLLEPFEDGSYQPEREEGTRLVQKLQGHLQLVRSDIQHLRSESGFQQFVSSGERAESLAEWDKKIGATMNDIQFVMSVSVYTATVQKEREDLIDRLGDGNYGARDSEIQNITCLPGTRVDILAQINEWVKAENSERVFWLRGMAGRGKSAIASTVAYAWRDQKASCALFHFRRGQVALSSRLVRVLARQLICHGTPEVKEAVLQAVRDNRDVATMRLEDQFRILLVDPLRKVGEDCAPVLLTIDALDECEDPEYAVRFINAIASHPFGTRVRFLLTSRPENALVSALRRKIWREGDLDGAPSTTKDIATFLQRGLERIASKKGLGNDWPSEDSVNRLAELSQNLFQWAHTALKYIDGEMPKVLLRSLLRAAMGWNGLDGLYHEILSRAFERPERTKEFLCRVLGIIVAAPYPVSLETIAYLWADDDLLADCEPDEIVEFLRLKILGDLTSMLVIPTSPADPIQFMHVSIRDLVIDTER
ncbi:hypothetical protein FRC01_008342, partial [Tulasnella sp. 417]